MAAYALAFCVALPALLVWWASATGDDIKVPVLGPPGVGAAFVVAGGAAAACR